MKDRLLILMTILPALLMACATREKYDSTFGSWVGKPFDSLVRSWGDASGSVDNKRNDTRMYYFKDCDTVVTPGMAITNSSSLVSGGASCS
ncbi:hypothetical protein BH11PSE13_BH11PSE13_43580 [soil metagenome]